MQDHSRQNIDANDVIGPVSEGRVPSAFMHRKLDAKFCIASRKNAGRTSHRRFFWGNGRAAAEIRMARPVLYSLA